MWITLKPCIVTRDGESVRLGVQEPIPEAEFYTPDIRDRLVRTKFIANIPNPTVAKPAVSPISTTVEKEPQQSLLSSDDAAIPPKRGRGRPRKVKE